MRGFFNEIQTYGAQSERKFDERTLRRCSGLLRRSAERSRSINPERPSETRESKGLFRKKNAKLISRFAHRFISLLISFALILSPIAAQAQSVFNLPVPGAMVPLSPAFAPALLKGMTIHPDDPLKFDFIIDSGNTDFTTDQIKEESERLVKYFLASMTVPKDDLWVNLSPYESDRIIPEELGKTELGRDMLAQDYILKQLTASLMYPEEELGKKFWDRIYQRAQEEFGTSEIPVNTFNKVWILPESATVYEHEQTVYVVDARLKVMLDSDYMAMEHGNVGSYDNTPVQDGSLEVSESIIREIILPEIEYEVNHGKNFAPLRQIYHSLILAKWYKETVKNSLLSQVYVDQNKIAGVDLEDKTVKDQIYAQYMEAYKKGVFNYIKEDYDALSDEVIPRKYFSGGLRIGAGEIHRTSSPVRDTLTPKYRASVEVDPQVDGRSLSVSSSPIAKDFFRRREVKGIILAKLGDPSKKRLVTRKKIKEAIEILDQGYDFDVRYQAEKGHTYHHEGYHDLSLHALGVGSSGSVDDWVKPWDEWIVDLPEGIEITRGEKLVQSSLPEGGASSPVREGEGLVREIAEKMVVSGLHTTTGSRQYGKALAGKDAAYVVDFLTDLAGKLIDGGITPALDNREAFLRMREAFPEATIGYFIHDNLNEAGEALDAGARLLIGVDDGAGPLSARVIEDIKARDSEAVVIAAVDYNTPGLEDYLETIVDAGVDGVQFKPFRDVVTDAATYVSVKPEFSRILTDLRQMKGDLLIMGAGGIFGDRLSNVVKMPQNIISAMSFVDPDPQDLDAYSDVFRRAVEQNKQRISAAIKESGRSSSPVDGASSPVRKSDDRSSLPVVSLKGLKRSSFDDSARKYAKYNAAIKKAPKFEDFDSFLLWYIGQMAQTLPSRKKGGEKISAGYAVQALSHAGKIKGSVEAFQRSAGAYEYGRDNETIWKAPKFEDFDSFILWYTGQTEWTLPSGNEDGEMIGASYAVLVLDHAGKIEGSVKAFKMDATAYEYVRGYDAIRRAPKFKSFSRFIQWHIRQTPRTLPSGNEDGEKLGASYAVQILGHAGKIKEGSVEAFQRNAGAYERAVKEKEVISREIQRIWSQDIGAGLYQTDLKRLFARFDPEMLLNLNVKKAKRILSDRYRQMILEYAYEGYGKDLIARLEAQSSSPVSLPVLFADWPGKEGQTETVESIDQHLRLIREAVPDAQLRILSQFTGVGEQGPSALQEIIEQERPAIILVRSKTEAFKEEAGVEFLKMAKRNGVKAIIRMGAGYDNINEVAAADEGISVIRTHGNANSVAELSLFQLAALARMEGKELSSDAPGTNTRWEDLFKTSPEAYLELIKESKKWPDGTAKDEIIRRTAHLQQFIFDAISGKEVAYVAEALRGRTIGLLGFGPIAQEFAAKLQMIKDITGVKFTVLATSRSLTPGDPRLEGLDVVVVTREELFSASNIVSVHIPVKEALKITRKELLENPNIIGVINTARSGLLDTGLMREFLVAGGFYLGDFDLKPDTFQLFKDHLARAMLLPHIGAGTKDAKEGVKANTKGSLSSLLEIYLGQKTFSETSNIDLVNNVVPEQIEIPGSPTHASSPVVTGLADSSVDDEMYQTGIIGMPGEILQFDHIEGGILLMAEHSGGKSSLSIMLMERDPTLKAVAAGASEVQWIDSSGGKILSGRRRTESPIIYSRILGSRSVPMTENKSARVRWIVSLDGTSEDFLRKARKQGIEVIDVSDLNVFTQFEEISRRINNAVRSSSPVTEDGDVGGIDLNAIEVQRQGAASVDIQFDPVEVQQIIDMGIDGFAPVIINITPLPSVLPLLGLAPQRDEEEFELSRN